MRTTILIPTPCQKLNPLNEYLMVLPHYTNTCVLDLIRLIVTSLETWLPYSTTMFPAWIGITWMKPGHGRRKNWSRTVLTWRMLGCSLLTTDYNIIQQLQRTIPLQSNAPNSVKKRDINPPFQSFYLDNFWATKRLSWCMMAHHFL